MLEKSYEKNLDLPFKPWGLPQWRPLKNLTLFSLPIMGGMSSQVLITVGDVLVAGRISESALAAIGVAFALTYPVLAVVQGAQSAISSVLGELKGRGEDVIKHIPTVVAFWGLSSLITLVVGAILAGLSGHIGLNPAVVPLVQTYLWPCLLSLPLAVGSQSIRELDQVEHKVISSNLISVALAFANIGLNVLFAITLEMGILGLAWGTIVARVLTILLLGFRYKWSWKGVDLDLLKRICKLSLPVGGAIFAEVMIFCFVTLVIGHFSVPEIAAHNVLSQVTGFTFTLSFALSQAVNVKVAIARGEGDEETARQVVYSGFWIIVVLNMVLAAMYFFAGAHIFELFGVSGEVAAIGIPAFMVAAVFQVWDGIQALFGGILRGLEIGFPVTTRMIVGHWVVGVSVGLLLGVYLNMSVMGLWIGLATGLLVVAILLGQLVIKEFPRIMRDSSRASV